MKNKFLTVSRYIIINSVFLYSLYAAIILKIKGWENIATFVITLIFIIGVCIFIARNSEEVLNTYTESANNLVIPKWLNNLLDVAIAGFLIYHNWLWLGTMYAFASFAMNVLRNNAKEHVLKKLASQV